MRLDHLLSKEEVGVELLFRCQGEEVHLEAKSLSVAAKPHIHRQEKVLRKASFPRTYSSRCALAKASRRFRWRCAQGRHPFSSRTRWLRPKRPMVLCWRRHGRAGGCQNYNRKAKLFYEKSTIWFLYNWLLPVIRD